MISDDRLTIGIDAGHGGPTHSLSCPEGGTCSSCGTKAGRALGLIEGAYTREMADRLHDALPADIFRAVPLSHHLEDAPLPERSRRAIEAGCDLVLSLHVNESSSPRSSGAHMLWLPGGAGGHLVEDIALSIAKRWPVPLCRSLRPRTTASGLYIAGMLEPATDLWPRARNLLRCYQPTPTLLVEMFYASNDGDAARALEPGVQAIMLGALVAGAGQAARIMRPSPPPPSA